MSPKKIGKRVLCRLLENQVKRLRTKNDLKIVAISGSVGKTSTKLAIAKVLATKKAVIYDEGNYNDRLTVPLVIFGHREPGIYNLVAWARILIKNELVLRKRFKYEIAVVELGTDQPGQLKDFAYLSPDLVVLTAIDAEHMVYFGSLEKVAAEELTPLSHAKTGLINIDNVPSHYLSDNSYLNYGSTVAADYRLIERRQSGLEGQELVIGVINKGDISVKVKVLGAQGALSLTAAAAAADIFNLSLDDIKAALVKIEPLPGRMRLLKGVSQSVLLDDTYNASPLAVKAALNVLYEVPAEKRIAILGSMNELGSLSEEAHRLVGSSCDPAKLSLVVTIGKEADAYLAPAARANGCAVASFKSPYEAGQRVRSELSPGVVVLAKGSQNGVFAEEALKSLLADPSDSSKLVRQSNYWLGIKRRQFKD